jgi:hypothetical protein
MSSRRGCKLKLAKGSRPILPYAIAQRRSTSRRVSKRSSREALHGFSDLLLSLALRLQDTKFSKLFCPCRVTGRTRQAQEDIPSLALACKGPLRRCHTFAVETHSKYCLISIRILADLNCRKTNLGPDSDLENLFKQSHKNYFYRISFFFTSIKYLSS